MNLGYGILAESCRQFLQIDTPRQAQAKEETLFERSLVRNLSPFQVCSVQVSFQRAGLSESYGIHLSPRAAEDSIPFLLGIGTPEACPEGS